MQYPMNPVDDGDDDTNALAVVSDLAEANPLPPGLREQISAWIEPVAMNWGMKHESAMDCIEVAFPLIVAWIAEHPDTMARPAS